MCRGIESKCGRETLFATLHYLLGQEQKAYCNAHGLLVQAEHEVRAAMAAYHAHPNLQLLDSSNPGYDKGAKLKASVSSIRERRKKGMYGLCFGTGEHIHERIWRNGTAMAAIVYRS
jgi:hypothetical protein